MRHVRALDFACYHSRDVLTYGRVVLWAPRASLRLDNKFCRECIFGECGLYQQPVLECVAEIIERQWATRTQEVKAER